MSCKRRGAIAGNAASVIKASRCSLIMLPARPRSRPTRDRIASAVMTCFSSISPDSPARSARVRDTRLTRCRPRRRQPAALELAVERVAGGLGQRRELVEPVLVERGVEHAAAVERHPPGGNDARQDLSGRLPWLTTEQLLDFRSGDRDSEIEAIEQRAGQAPDVALARALVAFARARRAAAARAGVRGADQLEAGGHGNSVMLDPTDHDPPQFERLSETVEHLRRELAHLVEKQHAAVCERDLTGPERVRATADERRQRARVVRCAGTADA